MERTAERSTVASPHRESCTVQRARVGWAASQPSETQARSVDLVRRPPARFAGSAYRLVLLLGL
eukprot:926425-Alexandrium_andersonii.AAC.1